MGTAAILEALIESPNALKIIESANSIIAKESYSRKEFYKLMHEDCKAEFINGQVVFHSPVLYRHWNVSSNLSNALINHVKKNKLGVVGVEKVMIQLTRNDYEPDICFFKKEKADTFHSKQLLFPAPDFVVEIISESTEKNDRGVKWVDYASHGIAEYWIVDADKQTIEQYLLNGDEYYLAANLKGDGQLGSLVVEGFYVDWGDVFE